MIWPKPIMRDYEEIIRTKNNKKRVATSNKVEPGTKIHTLTYVRATNITLTGHANDI